MKLVPGEALDIGPGERRLLLLPALMFIAAALAGYAGTFVIRPPNYLVMVIMAAGGASAAFLIFAIPTQTLLLFRKLILRFGLAVLRGRYRSELRKVHERLTEAGDLAQDPVRLGDLAVTEHLLGATEAAQRDLGAALELAPENAALLNNLGVVIAEMGEYDRAAAIIARAVDLDPAPQIRTNLGLLAPLASDLEPFRRLISGLTQEQDATALNNIGVFHMRQGNLDLAWEWFLRATRSDPKSPHAWANLGLISYRRGRLREAVGHLITAGRAAPDDARIANNLGVVLAAAGKPAWSRQQLDRARTLEPANIGIRINSVSVQALEGHVEAAIRGLRSLVSGPYHRAEAYYNLAALQLATGDPESAAASAAAAVEEGEHSSDAYTNLAVALWECGRKAEAISHFQAAFAAADAGPMAASNLGRALMQEGQPERALEVLTAAREKWRGDPDLAFDLAVAALATVAARYRPDMSPAERRDFFVELHRSFAGLDSAVRRGGQAPLEAHVNMALYHYLRQEYVLAAEGFAHAAKLAPDILELRFLAGTAYGRAADHHVQQTEDGRRELTPEGVELVRLAIPHLEAACEAKDVTADALYNLGRCLYAIEEFDRALEVFRKALRLENSEEMNSLAALCAARQARQWQEQVRTQSLMSEARKEALTNKARQYLDTAVFYFRQALLQNELNPSLHGNMGLAYMLRNQQHDVEAALRHWQRMRAIAGTAMETRFAEFTQIASAEHATRVNFDDREVLCRDIDVFRWVSVLPPQPAGLHYVLEAVSVQLPWRLMATDETLKDALRLRDRIAARERALARLEA